jgi:N-acetylglutamate synthase-like GNAT family acetyltransferase
MRMNNPPVTFDTRPANVTDRQWIATILEEHWGSKKLVTRGRIHEGTKLLAFIAEKEGQRVGLATYHLEGHQCELVSLNSLYEGIGIGTALVQAVVQAARNAECRRLFLITTNDNLAALRFYQRRGFRLAALRPNALEGSRRLKPEIPLIGIHGLPLRDEIECELWL